MGIVRPPWISQSWFKKYTFNYCDHFGDKETLSIWCKICRQEKDRLDHYSRLGENPYNWNNVFKDVGESLAKAMFMLQKDAAKHGIDLDKLPDIEEVESDYDSHPLYQLAQKYGNKVEKTLHELEVVPVEANTTLITKTQDVLAYSRTYIQVKIHRALFSRWEERDDSLAQEIADSKTSALFAYMAAERNSRALQTLANHPPLKPSRKKFLSFAKTSLDIAELIREEFFPAEKLRYTETGCESYDSL